MWELAVIQRGHGSFIDDAIRRVLQDKVPYATRILTQICFDPTRPPGLGAGIRRNAGELRGNVGMPGPVSRQWLVRVSAGLGLGHVFTFNDLAQTEAWRQELLAQTQR